MTGKPSHITISFNQQYLEGTWYRLFDLAPDEHLCIPDFATTRNKKSNVLVKVSSTHVLPSISQRLFTSPLNSHARGADQ